MSEFINVINSSPVANGTTTITPETAKTAGVCLVWAKTNTQTNTTDTGIQTNFICQSSQSLMLDGYTITGTQNSGCYLFKAIVNFTLLNPIYTDDENDLCLLYIVFPSTGLATDAKGQPVVNSNDIQITYNSEQSFNITCSMHNLGSMANSPIYQMTSTSKTVPNSVLPCLVIPINKWFAFRSPGSIYQLRVEGYTNTLCSPPAVSTNSCPCNVAT